MVASSVVLTVVVLNYHHRCPTTHSMPNWVSTGQDSSIPGSSPGTSSRDFRPEHLNARVAQHVEPVPRWVSRCQVSGVRWQESGVIWQESGVLWQESVSWVKLRVSVVIWQDTWVRWLGSLVRGQMAEIRWVRFHGSDGGVRCHEFYYYF